MPSGKTYTCPFCGAVSANLNDVSERYCGRCHRWADDRPPLRASHDERLRDFRSAKDRLEVAESGKDFEAARHGFDMAWLALVAEAVDLGHLRPG